MRTSSTHRAPLSLGLILTSAGATMTLALLLHAAMPRTIAQVIAATSVVALSVGALCVLPGTRDVMWDVADGVQASVRHKVRGRQALRLAIGLDAASIAVALLMSTAGVYALMAHTPIYVALPITTGALTALLVGAPYGTRAVLYRSLFTPAGRGAHNEGETA